MKTKRETISKRVRFEIFKRDGFVCQYCGQRPPDVVLEVDHMHPCAEGGGNDPINLVTSCDACNRGKGARLLRDVKPRPDADLEYLELQQESAEIKRYLESKKVKRELEDSVIAELQDVWFQSVRGYHWAPEDKQFKRWFAEFSPDEIEFAIRRAAARDHADGLSHDGIIRYASGIMNRRREESGVA